MSAPKIADIVRATAAVYGLTVDEMRHSARRPGRQPGGRPVRNVSDARQVATYLARELTGRSWRLIADRIGDCGLDTGTAVYRWHRCADRLAGGDADLESRVAAVMARLALAAVAAPLPAPNPATPTILREATP